MNVLKPSPLSNISLSAKITILLLLSGALNQSCRIDETKKPRPHRYILTSASPGLAEKVKAIAPDAMILSDHALNSEYTVVSHLSDQELAQVKAELSATIEEDYPIYLLDEGDVEDPIDDAAIIEPIDSAFATFDQGQMIPYGYDLIGSGLIPIPNQDDVRVCIIDTGYKYGHPDLPTDQVTGYALAGKGDWKNPTSSHGTHVAGTIAALDNNQGIKGIYPGVSLHIVDIFDDEGNSYGSDLTVAVDHCVNAGAKVINMSLGSNFSSQSVALAMASAYKRGVIMVASAGNDGDSSLLYPASYKEVISVSAIDRDKDVASFSQHNDQIELAAPGVDILSTIPPTNVLVATVNSQIGEIETKVISGSAEGQVVSKNLVNCGLGLTPCEGVQGSICLIRRGEVSFAQKAENCSSRGGVAVVIYNNAEGLFNGTLGEVFATIPVVGIAKIDGERLLEQRQSSLDVLTTWQSQAYDHENGTSMASPHVAGAIALVWSHFPTCRNDQIRRAFQSSAQDLGDSGRDSRYGFGLVQVDQAYDLLDNGSCGEELPDPKLVSCRGWITCSSENRQPSNCSAPDDSNNIEFVQTLSRSHCRGDRVVIDRNQIRVFNGCRAKFSYDYQAMTCRAGDQLTP